MKNLCLYFLAVLVLSICQFVVNSSGEKSNSAVKQGNLARDVNKNANYHERNYKPGSPITRSKYLNKNRAPLVTRQETQVTKNSKIVRSTTTDTVGGNYSEKEHRVTPPAPSSSITPRDLTTSNPDLRRIIATTTIETNRTTFSYTKDESGTTEATTEKKRSNNFVDREKKRNDAFQRKLAPFSPSPALTVANESTDSKSQDKKINKGSDETGVASQENTTTNETTFTTNGYNNETNTNSLIQILSVDADSKELKGNSSELFKDLLVEIIRDNSTNNETDDIRENYEVEDDSHTPTGEGKGSEEVPLSLCPTCGKNGLSEEDAKQYRLEMFRKMLSEKLRASVEVGYQSDAVVVEALPNLPSPIVEETLGFNDDELQKEQFYARDEEVIIPGNDMEEDCISGNATGCFSFRISNKVKREVATAQLWFYKTRLAKDRKPTFSVFFLRRHKSGNLSATNYNFPSEAMTFKEDWVILDITKVLRKWVDSKVDVQMLAIQCTNCKDRNYTTVFGLEQYKPMLVVKYVMNSPAVRNKRSELCDPRSECCPRELVVTFHTLGMVEVYQPRNMSVGYCYGSCNEVHQATFNNSMMRQRMRSVNPSISEQIKPCCVPLVLKDAFLLVIQEQQYIRKLVPKVTVETCGCV